MEDRIDYVQKFRDMLSHVEFVIPSNTSSKYYINAILMMLEKGCSASFENNKVIVWDEAGTIVEGIHQIELFIGSPGSKIGLIFKIKSTQPVTHIEIENTIEVNSFKKGILSEREQLSFTYQGDFYRYDYLREYEMDGTCIYHNSRDLAQHLSSSAKLYDKGILISLFNVKDNERKSIIIPGDYLGEKRKQASLEIKKGKIFNEINSPEGKEVPYKPYPFSESEFEKLLLKV